MKRIPAGIFVATLFFASLAPSSRADESAYQLANQTLGGDADNSDESAEDLAKQQGVAIKPGVDTTQSAQSVANQQGLGDTPGTDPEESAAALAAQQGVGAAPAPDESAKKLAEQAGVEKKSKKIYSSTGTVFSGEGVNGSIYAVVTQPDGAAIIGGRFTTVDGQPRANLARIKADGSLDPSFLGTPDAGVSGAVYALALDAQGNLLVGGYFTSQQGQGRQNFVRYLSTGAFDPAFDSGSSPNGPVYAVTVRPDGKIVIGGEFTQIGDVPRRNLARFNPDGTLDTDAASAGIGSGSVRSVAALPGGTVLAGGTFEVPGRSARNILSAGN